MSSRASRRRHTSTRSRRQRIAAGAVLATSGLLGTYLAAIRPQPTYASPNTGASGAQGRSLLQPRTAGDCSTVTPPLVRVDVSNDTTLRAAVATADDTTFICITQNITLASELSIDDTTLTIAGDDSTVTVDLGGTSRFLDVNFTGDDTLTVQGLTIVNGYSGNTGEDGGAIRLSGNGTDGALVLDYVNFIANTTGPYYVGTGAYYPKGGAVFAEDVRSLSVTHSRFEDDTASFYGGAIYANVTDFTVSNSTFEGNIAQNGAGGAIYSGGDLSVSNSFFTGNRTLNGGGAIFADVSIDVQQSTFTNNRTRNGTGGLSSGGAIQNGGAASVYSSVFFNNYAETSGGGVYSKSSAIVEDSLFSRNDSGDSGAGLYVRGYSGTVSRVASSSFISNGDDIAPDTGGAIYKVDFDLEVANSLFSANKASQHGGAVYVNGNASDDTITYTTIIDSVDGGGIFVGATNSRVFVQNSILWGNYSSTSADDSDIGGNPGSVTLLNSTYTDANSILGITPTGSVAGDPLLQAAGDNGGPSIGFNGASYLPTTIPGSGSPAIGLANSSLPPLITLDQIGVSRTTTPTNTAGAMWAPANPNPAPPTPTPTYPPSAPLSVVGQAGNARATISWTTPASAGSFPITEYQAVLAPGGQTCLVQAPLTTCSITGLTNGTPYTASVRALNGAGWGAYSSASEQFTPNDPASKTIVIIGSRGEVRGKPGVRVDGTTTGLVGATLQAKVRLAGQTEYSDAATRVVDPEGTFSWQRRTGKKVYVFFITETGEVRSNRVIIDAR